MPTNTTVIASSEAISCDLDGEAVILHVGSGTYFGLNPLGAEIWSLIQQERTVSEICDRLLDEYDVGREQCETEVMALLCRLKEEGLIRMTTHEVTSQAVHS